MFNTKVVVRSPQEEIARMGRRRGQHPKLKKTTSQRPEWWFRYREYQSSTPGDFEEKSKYLGYCDEMGRREAMRQLDAFVLNLNDPHQTFQRQTEFGDIIDQYVNTVLDGGGVKGVSAHTYKSHIKNHIRPKFGVMRLSDVTPQVVEQWANGLVLPRGDEKGLSSATQHVVVSVFQAIWRKARKWGYTQQVSPAEDLGLRPKRDTRSRQIPTVEQYRKIVARLGQPLADIAELAASTAMRISEIRGLAVKAVDIQARCLWVVQRKDQYNGIDTPKSPKSCRALPLGNMADKIAARIAGKRPEDLIFADCPNYASCQYRLRNAAREAGFASEGFGWHALRGLHATHGNKFYTHGGDLQKQMGHSTAEMTERYIRDGGEDFQRREAAVIAYQRFLMGDEEGTVHAESGQRVN